MTDVQVGPPPPYVITAPDGSQVTVLGNTLEAQQALIDKHEAEWAPARARNNFLANAAGKARQALTLNDQIRTGMQAFIDATPPATTGAQLTFLYNQVKAISQSVIVLAQEGDGLIDLFATVLPVLGDLVDNDGQ